MFDRANFYDRYSDEAENPDQTNLTRAERGLIVAVAHYCPQYAHLRAAHPAEWVADCFAYLQSEEFQMRMRAHDHWKRAHDHDALYNS